MEGMCQVSDSHLYVVTCFERQHIIKEFKKESLSFFVENNFHNIDEFFV